VRVIIAGVVPKYALVKVPRSARSGEGQIDRCGHPFTA